MNFKLGILTIVLCCLGQPVWSQSVWSQSLFQESKGLWANSSTHNSCDQDLESLMPLMLRDLPSYTNRVIQRSRRLDLSSYRVSYIVTAGKAEFEPISLSQSEYNEDLEPPKQVFFTTLERTYANKKLIQTQNYHWVFLVPTNEGWQMALIYSRLGGENPDSAISPPRESSNSAIGQAIRLWLRDCRAGTIIIDNEL